MGFYGGTGGKEGKAREYRQAGRSSKYSFFQDLNEPKKEEPMFWREREREGLHQGKVFTTTMVNGL